MKIAALVSDLMDRSRISAAAPDTEFLTTPSNAADAGVVVVDLARFADSLIAVRAAAPTARIVAYGSHVDDAVLDRARAEGADLVLPRSRFFRDLATHLA